MSGDHPNMYLHDAEMNKFIAQAEFEPFAPASCSCYAPCNAKGARQRTYWNIYGNRSESNFPLAPFCCLTQDICIVDMIRVNYFDKPFHVAGTADPPCCCIPCTCCGPPVIYSFTPKTCGIDCSSCCGQKVKHAPCNLFGCKQYLICGNPCYEWSGMTIGAGIKNADDFLGKYKGALKAYSDKTGIPFEQFAIFTTVSDDVGNLGGTKKIGGAPATPLDDEVAPQVAAAAMDRAE